MTADAACNFDQDTGRSEYYEAEPPRLQFRRIMELQQSDGLDYVVKGVIDRGTVGCIFGPSQSGKTFFALDLAYAVERGLPSWHGCNVRQMAVAYIAAEGDEKRIRRRGHAYQVHHGIEDANPPIFVLPEIVNIFDEGGDLEPVISAIRALDPMPGLVIIETVSWTMGSGDENKNADAAQYIRHCGRIAKATGAAVIFVHHCGKDPKAGERGAYAFRANPDTSIEVTHNKSTGLRTAHFRKVRDGPSGAKHAFKLEVVELGTDPEGDEITSCVAVDAEPSEYGNTRSRLAPRAQEYLDALQNCIATHGVRLPETSGYPSSSTMGVTVVQWQEQARLAGAVRTTEAKRIRGEFWDYKSTLKKAHAIAEFNGHVWLVAPTEQQTNHDYNT